MKKKIIGIFVCTLMIATALSATGAMNFQKTSLVNENNYYKPYQNTPANSDLITIKFVAKVDWVFDPNNHLGGAIKENDTITGEYTYDTKIPDKIPDETVGNYYQNSTSCGIEVKTGEFVFKTNKTSNINDNFYIRIYNDYSPYKIDAYEVCSLDNLPRLIDGVYYFIYLGLMDYNGTAISSDDLPTTAPILSDWGGGSIHIMEPGKYNLNNIPEFDIGAYITKITKSKAKDTYFTTHPILIWLLERFQNIFPMLRNLIKQY